MLAYLHTALSFFFIIKLAWSYIGTTPSESCQAFLAYVFFNVFGPAEAQVSYFIWCGGPPE